MPSIDDEDTRRALLWLTELVLPTPDAAVWCVCGHDISEHASTGERPDAFAACLFPNDGPVRLCDCGTFTLPPAGDD